MSNTCKYITKCVFRNNMEGIEIFIYYTIRGLKILDYTRRVARKHVEYNREFSILELYTGGLYHE
jgi:hypothetical protein